RDGPAAALSAWALGLRTETSCAAIPWGYASLPQSGKKRSTISGNNGPLDIPTLTLCATHRTAKSVLFDHLVGAGEERGRHIKAERLGGLEMDDKLVFGCRLHR